MTYRGFDYGCWSAPPASTCLRCGAYYVGAHYCGSIPIGQGAQPAKQLTEDDVRRIVREELQRAKTNDWLGERWP